MSSKQALQNTQNAWLADWNAKLAEIESRVVTAYGGTKAEDTTVLAPLRVRHDTAHGQTRGLERNLGTRMRAATVRSAGVGTKKPYPRRPEDRDAT